MTRNLTPADRAALSAYIHAKIKAAPYTNLALHMVSAHANAAGLTATHAESRDNHDHEHHGPGGIRNHSYSDHFWDADKVAVCLIEAAEPDTETIDGYKAAIDDLMDRPDETTRIAPGAHLHDWDTNPLNDTGYTGEQCPITRCDRYPRTYDLTVTRTPDGDYKHSTFIEVFSAEEDRDQSLALATDALTEALEPVTRLATRHWQAARVLPVITAAQARLANLPLDPPATRG